MQVPLFTMYFDSHSDAEAARREAGARGFGVVSGSPSSAGADPESETETWVLQVMIGTSETIDMHLPKVLTLTERHKGRYGGRRLTQI